MERSISREPIRDMSQALAQLAVGLRDLAAPLEPAEVPIYQGMLQRLQRDMLGLLLLVSLPLSIVFGVQLAHNTWATQTMPAAMFTIHLCRVLVIYTLVPVLLWRGQMRGAWTSLLTITLSTLPVQIWLIQEPGLLVFALFSMAGPALVLPLRVTVLLSAVLIAALWLIVALTFPASLNAWMPTALFFATVTLGLALMGVVVRRWLRQFAQITITQQRAAVAQARLEQQASDLAQKVAELASLEHDLRQPLRAVQGYLAVMPPASHPDDDLVTPALAAAGRAERLVQNVLDQASGEVRPYERIRQPVDLSRLCRRLDPLAQGLAHYYTDPPIPVRFHCSCTSIVQLNESQVERALLNLLDNALVQAPLGSEVTVLASTSADTLVLEVHDRGPGIPVDVQRALAQEPGAGETTGRLGLGLRQVASIVRLHGGHLTVHEGAPGTIVRLTFPLEEAPACT